jgi:hypothetical protein
MVHGREVYIVGYTPRVNGWSPGAPRRVSGSNPSIADGPYTGSIGNPDCDVLMWSIVR